MTKKRKQMRKEIHKGTTLCNCWFLVTNCEQRTSSYAEEEEKYCESLKFSVADGVVALMTK